MKKSYLILIMMVAMPLILCAQNNVQDAKEQISQVLRQEEEFLYADQTCATAEQALHKAQEILNREIQAYLGQDSSDTEVVRGTVTDKVVTITVSRGDKYRAFVYIDKSGLSSIPENTILHGSSSVVKPMNSNHTSNENENNDIKEFLLTLKRKNQIYDYILMLKNDGENAEWYNQPYSSPDLAQMYLVLYKRGGEVEAILTPADDKGERTNLASGQLDSRAKHPGTSINGFLIK